MNKTQKNDYDILLVSEIYPPAIGGSGVLFEGLYSRVRELDICLLTDGVTSAIKGDCVGGIDVVKKDIRSDYWGMIKWHALKHHWGVASQIKNMSTRGKTIVHCGRILPEGLAAYLAKKRGGADYVCWAHGEDVSVSMTSKEMAFWTKLICKNAIGLLANSENTAELLYEIGVPREKVDVITPGVDPDVYHPRNDGAQFREALIGAGGPLVVSIGRMEERKGFDLVIKAVKELREEFPEMCYAIIGGGGDQGPKLKAMIEELGVGDHVKFIGKVPFEDLRGYYAASDFFVHPNRAVGADIEGFGIVFLEAAATGKATIGGDSGGVKEAVKDGVTGLLVDGEDVNSLIAAMRRLMRDPDYCKELGVNGRQRVLDELTWDCGARKLEAVQDGYLGS